MGRRMEGTTGRERIPKMVWRRGCKEDLRDIITEGY
jgi:hypothetical protein